MRTPWSYIVAMAETSKCVSVAGTDNKKLTELLAQETQ